MLDLWGLASNEARASGADKNADWLDDITRRHGAGLAIIYREWFPSIPSSWTLVGELHLSVPTVLPSEESVQFYATGSGDPAELGRQLRAFSATLPKGVRLTLPGN